MSVEKQRAPRFLTIEQASLELNIGQPLIRALLKSGELRGLQIGGRNIWRIGFDDLQAYVDEAYRRTALRIESSDLDDSSGDVA